MKLLLGILVGVIVFTGVIFYLDHRLRDPEIPKFVPAKRMRTAARVKPSVRRLPYEIEGDIRQRRVVAFALPEYPEWAEEQGIMGVYKVRVTVSPAGEVKSFVQLLQTTGYPDMDAVALQAVRTWRFNEISSAVGDQEGTITFRFQLTHVVEIDRPILREAARASLPALQTVPSLRLLQIPMESPK